MKNFLLILGLLFFNFGKAQPGWWDLTSRYFYTILDENGKEISFKNDKNYSIMIDSTLYKSPNIPQDSLKLATPSDEEFQHHIRINDFSLAVPQKNYYKSNKSLEIKIIHEKDTMSICQPSGIDTLKFIAGHYYFPNWSSSIFHKLPKTYGKVKIVNADQRNFIVPKTMYDSIFSICFGLGNLE
ncbi:MAG: hypothetical protein LBE36_00545 [Flavobacteriaceae bacterium]|jgi:hypothetical protein|nr:hypothetical protein [Flavobacteriaceae bacterium]